MWSCGRALGWRGRLGDPAEFRGREPDPSVAGLVNWYNSGPEGGFLSDRQQPPVEALGEIG